MLASIFNDVIGPVMRGPARSSPAAALRIGRLARDLMGGVFDDVLVEFDRHGSLPTTHDTQGSDWGLGAGLMEVKSPMGVIVAAPPAGANAQRLGASSPTRTPVCPSRLEPSGTVGEPTAAFCPARLLARSKSKFLSANDRF